MQFLREASTPAARVGVLTQPRLKADIGPQRHFGYFVIIVLGAALAACSATERPVFIQFPKSPGGPGIFQTTVALRARLRVSGDWLQSSRGEAVPFTPIQVLIPWR